MSIFSICRLGRAAALVSVVGAGALFSAPVQAVTAPYFNDFSTSVSDFTETTNAQWNLTGTGLYNNTISTNNSPSSATVQVTNLGGAPATAQDFRISTQFTVNSFAGGDTTVGLAALGTTPGLNSFYLGDVQLGEDDVRLVLVNPNNIQVDTDAGFNVTTDVLYELTLSGEYTGTNILLTLSLTDVATPANTITVSTTFNNATGPQGQYFGLRNRTSGTGGSNLNVDFDYLLIQTLPLPIPEPTTFVLGAMGLGVMAMRRRRQV